MTKIKINTNEIKNIIVVLDSQKINKRDLVDENEIIKRDLSNEYIELNSLIAQVNKNQKKYSSNFLMIKKFLFLISQKVMQSGQKKKSDLLPLMPFRFLDY